MKGMNWNDNQIFNFNDLILNNIVYVWLYNVTYFMIKKIFKKTLYSYVVR